MTHLIRLGQLVKSSKKLQISLLMILVVIALGLLYPQVANASAADFIGNILTAIFYTVFWLFGNLSRLMIELIIIVSNYNGFIENEAVMVGWALVRDVCNMLFIIVLLTIAVSTILGIQSYSYRTLLGKFIIMVVLINFSKLIAGFFIDMSQVIMLTFVKAYKEVIAYSLFASGGFSKLLAWNPGEAPSDAASFGTLAAVILGTIMIVVMFLVLLVLFVILLVRIIMLWLLVIISPIAYLASTFPGGNKYTQQWWKMFGQYVVIGPVLAFFLWLTVMIIHETKGNPSDSIIGNQAVTDITVINDTEDRAFAITQITETGNFLSYGITIVLLVFSLTLAQQSGVIGSQLAGKAVANIGKISAAPLKFTKRRAGDLTRLVGRNVDNLQRRGQQAFLQKTRLGRRMTGAAGEEKMKAKRAPLLEALSQRRTTEMGNISTNLESALSGAGITAEQTAINSKRATDRSELDAGTITQAEYDNKKETIDKDQKQLDVRRRSISTPFEDQQRTAEAGFAQKKQEIFDKYSYKAKLPKRVLAQLSETGLSLNVPMLKQGWQDFSARRYKKYAVGKRGAVHDLLSIANPVGREKTTHSIQEDKSYQAELAREIVEKTQMETDQLQIEFLDATKSKDNNRIMAAALVMAQNVDTNEMLKGPLAKEMKKAMVDALTIHHKGKHEYIYDKDGNRSTDKVEITPAHIEEMVNAWGEKGEVNSAYFHEFLRHTFMNATNGNEDQAARMAKQVGIVSLANGQGQFYGAQSFDPITGKMKFEDMTIHEDASGKVYLDINDRTSANIRGKFANFAGRTMMRVMHPGMIGIEKADGSLGGMSKANRDSMVSFINMGQINTLNNRSHEYRPDFLAKPVESEEWKDDVHKLIDDLKTNPEQFIREGIVKDAQIAREKADMLDLWVRKQVAIHEGQDQTKVT